MTSSGEVSNGAGGRFVLAQVSEASVMVGLVLCGGWGEADLISGVCGRTLLLTTT